MHGQPALAQADPRAFHQHMLTHMFTSQTLHVSAQAGHAPSSSSRQSTFQLKQNKCTRQLTGIAHIRTEAYGNVARRSRAPERVVVHGSHVGEEHLQPALQHQRLITQVPVALLARHHVHSNTEAVADRPQRQLQCSRQRQRQQRESRGTLVTYGACLVSAADALGRQPARKRSSKGR
eukprot:GHRQ01029005.1.p1 GENE.GHRQ01029005.1~~GHRQ01029005.1.p1  ORF type:complete len:178 (+),score=20.75 GHRQ01029005.1:35-568(+)